VQKQVGAGERALRASNSRALNFVLRWTGNADINLTVVSPSTDVAINSTVYPIAGFNLTPNGGATPFDHRGGPQGGIEVAYWLRNPPDGRYFIGAQHISGPDVTATMDVFQNGQRMGQSDEHGVIDLKPILAAGGAMKSRTEPLYTPANEIHPLGFALSVPPEKKTPVAVFAAAAVAAVLFLAVGLGFALRGGSDEPTAANIRQPVSVAAAAPVAATPSTSTISPDTKIALADKSSKSDSKSDSADAVSPMKPQMVSSKVNAKVYSASSPNRSWKSSSKASSNFTPKSSAPPSPPKAKGGKKSSSDPCGCGGNLACAMKCGL